MTPVVKEVFGAALGLSKRHRVALTKRLLESLEPVEVDPAWIREIRKRLKDYDEGKVKAIPLDRVLQSLPHRASQ